MRFTVFAVRRNSPSSGRSSMSSAMACERSPLATAPMTRAISLVGCTRSPISALMEPSEAAQAPLKPPSEARWVILPSLPTTLLRRSSSRAIFSLSSMTSLKVSAILPAMPVHSRGRRTAKFPFLNAVNTESSVFSSSRSRFPSKGGGPPTGGAGRFVMGGARCEDSRETDNPLPFMAPSWSLAQRRILSRQRSDTSPFGPAPLQTPCPPESSSQFLGTSGHAHEAWKSQHLPWAEGGLPLFPDDKSPQ